MDYIIGELYRFCKSENMTPSERFEKTKELIQNMEDFDVDYVKTSKGKDRTMLYYSCRYGILKLIILLAKDYSADPNKKFDFGYPIISILASRGQLLEMKFLVGSSSVNLDLQDNSGRTPLFIACYFRHHNVVEYLIEKGSDINAIDKNGNTALNYVCRYVDDVEIVNTLLKNGSNVNSKNNRGNTPLNTLCIYSNNIDILNLLISFGADPYIQNNEGRIPVSYAVEKGKSLLMSALVYGNKSYNDNILPFKHDNKYIIVWMAHINNLEGMEKLLKKYPDLRKNIDIFDADGNNAIMIAIVQGNYNMMKLLIDNGASVDTLDSEGRNAINWCVSRCGQALRSGEDRTDLLRILELIIKLTKNIDHRNDNHTPLMFAINFDDVKVVEMLLKNGADVNITCNDGNTALMYAVENMPYYNPTIVCSLMASGANPHIKNNRGVSPYDITKFEMLNKDLTEGI